MKQLLSFFFAISFFSGYTQIEFEDHIVDMATVTTGANDVKSADIDGDGNIDILSSSGGDNKIAWYRNLDGQGTFGFQQIISSNAQGAKVVEVADLDGDGDLDVASASAGDNKIAWYENLDGQGSFSGEIVVTSNSNEVSFMQLVDMEGDGDMDIVAAGSNYIHWFENIDGQGNFSVTQIISTNVLRITSMYVVDIDNDGDQDVFHTSWNSSPPFQGKVAWFENIDGQGNFSDAIVISNLDSAYSVYATDVDNDDDIDVIASGFNNYSSVIWYENTNGQGNFSSHLISNEGSAIVYAADVNADGKMDVLSGYYDIYWHQNLDGNGNFAPRIPIISVQEIEAVDWNDLDNDGFLDLLTASSLDNNIAWYKNLDGNGNFGPRQVLNTIPNRPQSLYAADLDTDGDNDILSQSWFEDKVFWYKNLNGHEDFGNQLIITDQCEGVIIVSAADMDGDGDIDVLSGSPSDGEIVWYENTDGQGNFGTKRIIHAFSGHGNSNRKFVVSDMDLDGDLDVVCTGSGLQGDNRILWRENDGQGNFSVTHLISNQVSIPWFLSVADLDNDGDMDVVVLNATSSHKTSWFENIDGAGNFGSENILTTGSSGVETADIDGDGYIDIKVDSYLEIAWFRNINGTGNFEPKQIIENSYYSHHSSSVDLDDDGDLDVLSASSDNGNNRRLVWYEHLDGHGTFGDQQVLLLLGDNYPFFYTIDMDIDGDMDIVYGSFNRIGWLENLTILSSNELNNENFFVYPNPTTGLLKITSTSKISKIEVYNNIGQLLAFNTGLSEIDISTLDIGMYFVIITSETKQTETKKIIKK